MHANATKPGAHAVAADARPGSSSGEHADAPTDVDVLVVGGGAMGLSTAWRLARRGRTVRLVEQYERGHHLGASHGATRNFNPFYTAEPYVSLVRRAYDGWRELEADAGTTLLDLVGLVSHASGADGGEFLDGVVRSVAGTSFAAERWSPADAAERWPGLRFAEHVVVCERAGRIRAAAALGALEDRAIAHGASVTRGLRAVALAPDESGVTVELARWSTAGEIADAPRERVRTRTVVVATAAWTRKLLDGVVRAPRLRVTQETPVHFPEFDERVDWPSFNRYPSDLVEEGLLAPVYGMLTPGEGIKVGWHLVGPAVDPDRRDFEPVRAHLDGIREYARRWLPGVDVERAEPISCTYTTAPDGRFVIGREGRVVVLSGFAGEGFKFVPEIGRLGADLAEGRESARIREFALDR